MPHHITVLPQGKTIEAMDGQMLLSALRKEALVVDAPCGGNGKCGKCKVLVDGRETLACRTVVDRDMTVTLADGLPEAALSDGMKTAVDGESGYILAFDLGTTTVVGYLLTPDGRELARDSARNPQVAFGADVISRIRHAMSGQMELLTDGIRCCADKIAQALCQKCGIFPEQVGIVSLVGNPAMQQLFFGILPENLARPPFAPVLIQVEAVEAKPYLPRFSRAKLLIVPDIAGFVGADTVACVLATGMDRTEDVTLLVDIGTNGEMVLGNSQTLVACAAAAGPALEGAGIRFGMRGQNGAIDHVRLENGRLKCSVIGGGTAEGICGSGLIDAVAAALEAGWLNERGKILTEDGIIRLTEDIYLTQEDIRQVQLAKGAIAAGIELMAARRGISLQEIKTVYLAGAFGTYMDPAAACRIGLLPQVLEDRITAAGNAAGSGAKMLACSMDEWKRSQEIADGAEALELSTLPDFPRCFARHMRF